MHLVQVAVAATALLAALISSASAEAEESETVGRFLLSMPARSLDPIIEHCSESVPEIRDDLMEERAEFIDKLNDAARPLMARLKDDSEFNSPVEDVMRQRVLNFTISALGKFKQQDPNVTCRTVLANIEGATVDDLSKVVEDTYRDYLQVARSKN